MDSEDSDDEAEVLRNFDAEAKEIVQSGNIPNKSSDRYKLVYNAYKRWQEENSSLLSKSDENNLIVYFNSLKKRLKPPTLWSIWSMLRKTLSTFNNINISNFLNLKCMIQNNGKGYMPKKSFTLKWDQIKTFMNGAPDDIYLVAKVIKTLFFFLIKILPLF